MKLKSLSAFVNLALVSIAIPAFAGTGPSTTTDSYILPLVPNVEFTSILTTGDAIAGYKMGGIPDGLGAYDNEDGTFTVLMNHEIFATGAGPLGITRAHGGKGAYVSEWVIDKKTLAVLSGADLMKNVYQKDSTGAWVPVPATGTLGQTSSFARVCSAD